MMSSELKKEIRYQIETQFRYNLYNDIKFPYLHSLGIKHLLQAFQNQEHGYIGILHLWWTSENEGTWKSQWYDTEQEGIAMSEKIINDSPVDGHKLGKVIDRKRREVMSNQINMELKNRIEDVLEQTKNEDEPEEGVLLN